MSELGIEQSVREVPELLQESVGERSRREEPAREVGSVRCRSLANLKAEQSTSVCGMEQNNRGSPELLEQPVGRRSLREESSRS